MRKTARKAEAGWSPRGAGPRVRLELEARRPDFLSGQRLVEIARTFVGTPFRHQGRTRYGVDCIGLAILARNELDPWPIGMREPVDYRRNPQRRLLDALGQHLDPITMPEPGAIALIAWPRQKYPSHVGIITPETIIHAYAAAGRVVEQGYRGQWLTWTKSLWRLPGIEP